MHDIDWGTRTVSVRINGLDTPFTYRDVIEVVEACPRIDMLFLPKVGVAADVYALDVLVTQIENAHGRSKRIGFEIMIETALGLCNVESIAQSSRRLEAMCFGSGDFAASTGARTTTIGGLNPDYAVLSDADAQGRRNSYPLDPWHAAQSRIVTACRAYGLRPLDGPYSDFNDKEGLLASSRRSAALGFEGRMVIHPSQIEPCNRLYAPSQQELDYYARVIEAFDAAVKQGHASTTVDGKMIDVAMANAAKRALEQAAAWKKAG